MKKIDLGQTFGILANVGVLGGLVFLGYEIRQNTTQLMRGEMNATMEQYSSWRHTLASNADLAAVWEKGHRDVTALTSVEKVRFDLMLSDSFWLSYQFWDRARVGAISQNWEEQAIGGARSIIESSEAGRRWWEERKSVFPSDYVIAVEDR